MENTTKETDLTLYKKLHKIQESVTALAKDKQSNSYSYVTGNKVLNHIKPLMNELGILLKQEVLSIENERQNYIVGFGTPKEREKSEIHSKVMMKFTWIDIDTGEKDENLFGANGQNDWDKGVGSALTYGERYFLLKFFHIATDEDDIDNPHRKDIKWAQTDDLMQYAYKGYSIEELKSQYKVRQQQESEYAGYLERFSKYPMISENISKATSTAELKEIAESLSADQAVYNDFKQMLNDQNSKINAGK